MGNIGFIKVTEVKAKRAAMVEGSREREKNKGAAVNDLFKKEKEQAKDGTPVERTLREVTYGVTTTLAI